MNPTLEDWYFAILFHVLWVKVSAINLQVKSFGLGKKDILDMHLYVYFMFCSVYVDVSCNYIIILLIHTVLWDCRLVSILKHRVYSRLRKKLDPEITKWFFLSLADYPTQRSFSVTMATKFHMEKNPRYSLCNSMLTSFFPTDLQICEMEQQNWKLHQL